MKISNKDWDRMSDLVLSGKDGAGTAKIIKDKNKAIARFVAGVQLSEKYICYDEQWKEFRGVFCEFGEKALDLGATVEEIQSVFDENEVPSSYKEKLGNFSTKKLQNRFVGDLSRKILKAGFDINYLPHNGFAITMTGKEAMERNGRKWTIGYKTEIDLGTKKVKLTFDAITDEGNGPTSYLIASNESDELFADCGYGVAGKLQFINKVMEKLETCSSSK